ncbi:sigma-E factor regulatory protein RseB [Vibrio sp. Of7-15]|uniref:sigma-E factor regulatory protein RseB n=1 Tax=Vibrio sp. Of7-15 TaxID=2724879 RepID=UPI001EF1FE41|nr:sigma-E factor regulatory protein RseB [Vibrio sp. Of7-15]MCG7499064.1 sigma-E factor regulatory protein RseB [Vibrio sp. Of7-15]
MKKILVSVLALVSLMTSQASAESRSAEALLHQMGQASTQLNYEMSYILIKQNSIEPLMYRYATYNEQALAHLVYLSGPVREVIRRGSEISYFEQGIDPFTIASSNMVAPIPPLMNSDIEHLSKYYDFVSMGKAREAGSACDVIRVVPKDGNRYSYMVWIDERSKLPLRTDLVSREGEALEQYRAVSYVVNDKIADLLDGLNQVTLPTAVSMPRRSNSSAGWFLAWKPAGFESINYNSYRLAITEKAVESQMYTDGLFNFSVYISDADSLSVREQLVRQGRRTFHSHIDGQREVTVVGDIPPSTAKRIAESVSFRNVNKKVTQ